MEYIPKDTNAQSGSCDERGKECQLKFIGTTVSQIKKQSLAQRKVVTSWTAWSSASPSPLCIMHTCT
jgi:hypothetical protein